VRITGIDEAPGAPFAQAEYDLLRDHQSFGCLSLWCATAERAFPFVFMPRAVKGLVPCAHLVYCPDISDFVRFARPLGRYLAARGRPLVIIDSNGPIAGIRGRYFKGRMPKYFKGPHAPGAGDLAYTEAVMFGF
jgi:hypothetical protein